MKHYGFGLLAIGMVVAIGALFMSTSVSTETPADFYGRTTASEVYNLGLLQHQMMIFVVGLAIALAGVVLAAAGVVNDQRAPGATIPIDQPQAQIEPRQPSVPRFTPAEQQADNKRADRIMFLFLGGVAVVGLIVAVIAFADRTGG